MGRLKKYSTVEDKKVANKIAANKYYWKNKDRIDESMKQKYHDKKNGLVKNLQQNNSEGEAGR